MGAARILVAMGNDTSISKLKAILTENGYIVVDQAGDEHECLRKLRVLKPDLIILDYNLPFSNGYELAKVVIEDKLCDVILIASSNQESMVGDLNNEPGFMCLTRPINRHVLVNTIELMIKSRRKIDELEKQIEELKANLDTRKEVEKAKGLLMKHLNLSEAEAFKRIQKQSMDRGIPMKEIARAIILAYDI